MEDRARAAATASRAKTSDSDTLRQNYVTPGLAGQPISTIDSSKSFNPNLSCQKTATLMEVIVQPSGTGDLGAVKIARDTDLDGTVDTQTSLPVPVSGICANGVIACMPGTWNQCRYFRWAVDASGALTLKEGEMTELAGCYCINNSCGSNLAWNNLPSVLGDLGGGMVGALTTADPRIGVAAAQVDGPVIRYVGAQTTACAADKTLPQSAYLANPVTLAGDAAVASSGSSVFQALTNSPAGLGKVRQLRACTIERQVMVTKRSVPEIIDRISGGYNTVIRGSSVDFYLGEPRDNVNHGGNCGLIDFKMTLQVDAPERIVAAGLVYLAADDWAQLRVDGQLIASGEWPWLSNGYPPGDCEQGRTFEQRPNIDLKPMLTKGNHEIWLRLGVGDVGEGIAQIHVDTDTRCQSTERVVDQCGAIAGDARCHLDTETVDGVDTFRNGVKTGLTPLVQTRVLGSAECPVQLTRPFFERNRTYACTLDSNAMAEPDLSRGTYILDHSTETILADQTRAADGTVAVSTRPFTLPDRGTVPACEPICKTRAPSANTGAAPAGVVASQQNAPASHDTFYHVCSADNVCPLEPGEEIVSACGCLDDFPEAVAMMQAVRLAGADMTCTTAVR
ncbi:hypothetical protein [Sphingomonas immobilis]|uniref:Uncharacterized protein n=1 Tax=Sphingomonas immobilis TaxID=3063997 RepID=A0ABT8ZVY7_9SPHN|nr:hypothetical protein [Sphingomonas sp. CA1-15]MDO7841737.1 hypothetical protein [Sphingomonas sp. CA1-15]